MKRPGTNPIHAPVMKAATPDTIVVGGGLVGVCAALYLQRSGRKVMLIERRRPGDGASGHNGQIFSIGNCIPTATPGVVRAVPGMLRDPLSPLAIRWSYLPQLVPWLGRFLWSSRPATVERASVALYSLVERSLDAYRPLIAGTRSEALVRGGGLLYGYQSAATFEAGRFGRELQARRGVVSEILDGEAVGRLDPALAGRYVRGLYLPGAPHTVDARAFTLGLAEALVERGGQLVQDEVVGFDRRGDRVTAVHTSAHRYATDEVVIAAGAWSRKLAAAVGVRVPLDTERGYGVDLPDPGVTLRLPVVDMDYHFALTPTRDGLHLAGTDELAGLDAPPNFARAERLVRAARTLFPELRTDGATQWMSYRPSIPDSLPVIGRVPRFPHTYLAFGHGHLGFTLAAITGQLVQELSDGKEPSVDLEPFCPTRFRFVHRHRHTEAITP